MAVTSIWRVKGWLGKVVIYVENPEKTTNPEYYQSDAITDRQCQGLEDVMHLCFVPITEDGRLSAKDIVGNRKKLTRWQDEYWAFMVKKYPDLERGESASKTGRTHLPPRIFKQATKLNRLEQKLRELLSSINPMNAKRVREEILKILDDYVPGVAELMTKTKALKRSEKELLGEIAALKKEANTSKPSVQRLLELERKVDSNLHREKILPSEKAFAYKLKMDAMSRQGERTDLTSCQVGTKFRTDEVIAQDTPDSARQVQRYIRLTELIPEILTMVDSGKIALTPAVELSYLTRQEQRDLLETMESEDCTPSLSQAIQLKKLSQAGELNIDKIFEILREPKANQQDKISFRTTDLKKYFPKSYDAARIQAHIIKLLEADYRKRQRAQSR